MSSGYFEKPWEPRGDNIVEGEVLSSENVGSVAPDEVLIDTSEGLPPAVFTGLAHALTTAPLHYSNTSFTFASSEGKSCMISRHEKHGIARTSLLTLGPGGRQDGSIVVDMPMGRQGSLLRAEVHSTNATFHLRKAGNDQGIWTYAENSLVPDVADREALERMLTAYAPVTVAACRKLQSSLAIIVRLSTDLFGYGPKESRFHLLPDAVHKTRKRGGAVCTIDSTLEYLSNPPVVQVAAESGDVISVANNARSLDADESFYAVDIQTLAKDGSAVEKSQFDIYLSKTSQGVGASALKSGSSRWGYVSPGLETLEAAVALLRIGAEIYPMPIAERLRRLGRWTLTKLRQE